MVLTLNIKSVFGEGWVCFHKGDSGEGSGGKGFVFFKKSFVKWVGHLSASACTGAVLYL